jgi:predicted metal-binding protein
MEIEKLVTVHVKKIEKDSIITTKLTQDFCKRPYPNHPKGCPNYGKGPLCPPHDVFIDPILREFNNFYLFFAKFDFRTYVEIRSYEKPEWSDKQLRCVLYWQSSVKKILKQKILNVLRTNNYEKYYIASCGSGFNTKNLSKYQEKIYSMESIGINVLSTLKKNKIEFERNPINTVTLVCLLCVLK